MAANADDSLKFLLMTSLLIMAPEEWRRSRLKFVMQALVQAVAVFKGTSGTTSLQEGGRSIEGKVVIPVFIYVALIERLHTFAEGGGSEEGWEAGMRTRFGDVDSMLTFSRELAPWIASMQQAKTIEEVLSISGLGGVGGNGE